MIWGFIGPEGSGKTTGMSFYSLLHIAMGGQVQTFPGYELNSPDHKKLSTDLDFKNFFVNLYDYKNTIICADEVQNFCDAQLSMTVFNRLIGYAAAQRRKANIGIFYTVQSWDWVYKRLRQLTHLVTLCYDLYWTGWGRENGLKRGEQLRMTTYDCKGFFTGRPWSLMSQKVLHGTALRPYFNSYAVVDLFEGMRKYEVKKATTVFDLRPGAEEPDESPFDEGPDMGKLVKAANDEELIRQLATNTNPKLLSKLQRRLNTSE